jgi:signal transduction histidine kinase
MEELNINDVVGSALMLMQHNLNKAGILVGQELAFDLPPVLVDRNKMEEVLINLVMNAINAINAMAGGGQLLIRSSKRRLSGDSEKIVVEIENSGAGIPEEVMAHIFEPFFTTDRAKGGTGLGLAIVKHTLEMHNASIDISNRAEGGVRVTILLDIKRKG